MDYAFSHQEYSYLKISTVVFMVGFLDKLIKTKLNFQLQLKTVGVCKNVTYQIR